MSEACASFRQKAHITHVHAHNFKGIGGAHCDPSLHSQSAYAMQLARPDIGAHARFHVGKQDWPRRARILRTHPFGEQQQYYYFSVCLQLSARADMAQCSDGYINLKVRVKEAWCLGERRPIKRDDKGPGVDG